MTDDAAASPQIKRKSDPKEDELYVLHMCCVCTAIPPAPWRSCQHDHMLCDRCKDKLASPKCPVCSVSLVVMRDQKLPMTAMQVLQLPWTSPCHYAGCKEEPHWTMLATHMETCDKRPVLCPCEVIYGPDTCKWMGAPDKVVEHILSVHGVVRIETNTFRSDEDILLSNLKNETGLIPIRYYAPLNLFISYAKSATTHVTSFGFYSLTKDSRAFIVHAKSKHHGFKASVRLKAPSVLLYTKTTLGVVVTGAMPSVTVPWNKAVGVTTVEFNQVPLETSIVPLVAYGH